MDRISGTIQKPSPNMAARSPTPGGWPGQNRSCHQRLLFRSRWHTLRSMEASPWHVVESHGLIIWMKPVDQLFLPLVQFKHGSRKRKAEPVTLLLCGCVVVCLLCGLFLFVFVFCIVFAFGSLCFGSWSLETWQGNRTVYWSSTSLPLRPYSFGPCVN